MSAAKRKKNEPETSATIETHITLPPLDVWPIIRDTGVVDRFLAKVRELTVKTPPGAALGARLIEQLFVDAFQQVNSAVIHQTMVRAAAQMAELVLQGKSQVEHDLSAMA